MKDVPKLMKYFSDIEEGQLLDRSFMWTILSLFRGEACKKLIDTTRNARGSDLAENRDELIEIAPDLLNDIMQAPLMSKSKMSILEQFKYYNQGENSQPSKTFKYKRVFKEEDKRLHNKSCSFKARLMAVTRRNYPPRGRYF